MLSSSTLSSRLFCLVVVAVSLTVDDVDEVDFSTRISVCLTWMAYVWSRRLLDSSMSVVVLRSSAVLVASLVRR